MQIVWTLSHLAAIRSYIAQDNPEVAGRDARRLLEAVEILTEQPHGGRPGRHPGTRELVVSGTPYIIPYRLRGDRIEILAVLHGARKWPDPS